MTDIQKGEILRTVSELPHDQKLVALGFLQGLSANNGRQAMEQTQRGDMNDHRGDDRVNEKHADAE